MTSQQEVEKQLTHGVTAKIPPFSQATLCFVEKENHLWCLRQKFHPEVTGEGTEKTNLPFYVFIILIGSIDTPQNSQTQHLFLGFAF